jgi:hypothetical protein
VKISQISSGYLARSDGSTNIGNLKTIYKVRLGVGKILGVGKGLPKHNK